jgi:small-conductance mechanosensitive channel
MNRPLIPRVLVLLACLCLGWAGPAHAQPAAPAKPAAAAPTAPGSVSADELARLVGTLQDDKARAQLVEELRGLIAAQRGVEEKEAAANPATLVGHLSEQVDTVSQEILAAASVVVDAPRLVIWFEEQARDEAARQRWLEVALKLSVIFGFAAVAEWVMQTLLRRPARRLAVRSSDHPLLRLLLVLFCAVLEVLPIFVFAAVAAFILPFTQPRFATAQVANVLIHATLWARGLLALARVALISPNAGLLYSLSDETRNYLYIWARRFTNWAVYGYGVSAGAWWLGVPGAIYSLLLRGTVMMLSILAIIFVLQNRASIGDWLRGRKGGTGDGRGWRMLRNRLAETWHIAAIIYIVGLFSVYALKIEGGFGFVLRATVLSVVVLLAAGLIVRFVQRLSRSGFAIRPELKNRFPTLEARANRYLPVLTLVISTVVYVLAALTLLQAWGVNAFSWLESTIGRKVTSGALTIGTVLLVALVSWEFFSSAIERYLGALDGNGQPLARSGRARTLLPLFRTSVLVLIILMVGLIVLSELGVNIAPLLAGAGVVGLAIGFGSQALVKDVITGLFILIEDTVAVGDVVDVGKGHSGVVEAISIRSIRLRDVSGTLHSVPFSEVTTVKNMSRDYSYVVCDVGVLYREDPDRVIDVLREVGEGLSAAADWAAYIIQPLEIFGVERFTDTAMIIRVRLKTVPMQQWAVAREFNRRIKKAFDQHGIEMPAGNQTHYLDWSPSRSRTDAQSSISPRARASSASLSGTASTRRATSKLKPARARLARSFWAWSARAAAGRQGPRRRRRTSAQAAARSPPAVSSSSVSAASTSSASTALSASRPRMP